VSEENPTPPRPLPRTRARLPFEVKTGGNAFRGASLVFYLVLTLGLAGLALYMGLVLPHPITSPYVAGPAIGALWFGLRLFMIWGSRR